MTLPTARQYNEAIQSLRFSVRDEELGAGQPALNSRGLPLLWSGNFAAVYKIDCPATGNTWALKCFTREAPGLRERYRHITARLEQARLPFMVDFRFMEPGIRVDGTWYPVLKMGWCQGVSLNRFVENYLDHQESLRLLLELWVSLAVKLRKAGIAHADLQHGNVLLVPMEGGKVALRLIDYDGMYVPTLAGIHSGELGHAAYQHPQRLRDGTYSAEVDRFPHLAIYCAIRCLMVGKRDLWERFNNDDNLLFREADFRSPGTSELFHALWELPDADCRALVGRLALACLAELGEVPLLNEFIADGKVLPLSAQEGVAVNDILAADKPRTRSVHPEPGATDSPRERPWWLLKAPPFADTQLPPVRPAGANASPATTPVPAGQPAALSAPSLSRPSSGHRRWRRKYRILLAFFLGCAGVTFLIGRIAQMAMTQSGTRSASPTHDPSPGNAVAPPLARAPFGAARAKELQDLWADQLRVPVVVTNTVGMKMAMIPAGEFIMGSPRSDKDALPYEQPEHRVTITKAFYLGICEVTVGQFSQFVSDTGYKTDGEKARASRVWHNCGWPQTDAHPVVCVTWSDAMAFCEWLSAKEGVTYRLPTEAEWEYACRAGTSTRYSFGDDETRLGEHAWYRDNSDRKSHPVGGRTPNAWGLCDMHGNAWEWCNDWFGEGCYEISTPNDPAGPSSGSSRALRGGSWYFNASCCRAAYRYYQDPTFLSPLYGFRIVRTIRSSHKDASQ